MNVINVLQIVAYHTYVLKEEKTAGLFIKEELKILQSNQNGEVQSERKEGQKRSYKLQWWLWHMHPKRNVYCKSFHKERANKISEQPKRRGTVKTKRVLEKTVYLKKRIKHIKCRPLWAAAWECRDKGWWIQSICTKNPGRCSAPPRYVKSEWKLQTRQRAI